VTRSRVWQQPAWYVYPAGRLRFIAELRACSVHAVPTRINRAHPPRHVRIVFAGIGSVPFVYVDGPAESPHRYSDGSLCMWYPYDPESSRWTRREGAAALLGHITAHLIREEWWRKTGEWVGDEAAHDEEDNMDGMKIA